MKEKDRFLSFIRNAENTPDGISKEIMSCIDSAVNIAVAYETMSYKQNKKSFDLTPTDKICTILEELVHKLKEK